MPQDRGEQINIRVKGDVTEEMYEGLFRVKTRLSHSEHLQQDRIRRELLGDAGAAPSFRASQTAAMLSALAVRVIDAPSWWKNSGEGGVAGLGLSDDNVISEVYDAAMRKDVQIARSLAKEAEQAQQQLAGNGPTP